MDLNLHKTLNFEGYKDSLNNRIKSNKIILAKYDISVTQADFMHKIIHKEVNQVYSFETHIQIKKIQEKKKG